MNLFDKAKKEKKLGGPEESALNFNKTITLFGTIDDIMTNEEGEELPLVTIRLESGGMANNGNPVPLACTALEFSANYGATDLHNACVMVTTDERGNFYIGQIIGLSEDTLMAAEDHPRAGQVERGTCTSLLKRRRLVARQEGKGSPPSEIFQPG